MNRFQLDTLVPLKGLNMKKEITLYVYDLHNKQLSKGPAIIQDGALKHIPVETMNVIEHQELEMEFKDGTSTLTISDDDVGFMIFAR